MDIKKVLQSVEGALYYDSAGQVHVDIAKALPAALAAGLVTAGPLGIAWQVIQLITLLQQAGLGPAVTHVGALTPAPAQAITFHSGGDH